MTLLPPTNEACGKVMFLHLSVILFRGCIPACSGWGRGVHPPPRQTSPPGRHTPPGQTPRSDAPLSNNTGYGQQAGGTHPTGMHSCFWCLIYWCLSVQINFIFYPAPLNLTVATEGRKPTLKRDSIRHTELGRRSADKWVILKVASPPVPAPPP